MIMEKIVVIGGGGHAKVIISILKKLGNYEIVGFTDNQNKTPLLKIPYLGDDTQLEALFKNGVTNAAIGVGQIKFSDKRKDIVKFLARIGFRFPAIISPGALINEDVQIGKGTVVMDGVIINSGSRIGEFSIINTKSSIDHDCQIGSFTHIAPGVTLCGEVKIGNNVLIGSGANVIQNKSIVDNTLVSAGSSVQKDISQPGIYRGVPAVLIREH